MSEVAALFVQTNGAYFGLPVTSWLQRTSRDAPRITKREADKTPPAFRDLLISLAQQSAKATEQKP